jgi:hypothetical protein
MELDSQEEATMMAGNTQKTDDRMEATPRIGETASQRDPGVYYCRQLLYRDRKNQETVVPESEVVRQYDGLHLYLDLAHMDIAVRMVDGSIYEPDRHLVGINGQPLCVLCKWMRRPGIFSTPYETGKLPPYHNSHFVNENIVQYVARLRRNLFREDKDHERFLLTLGNPYRVAFNGKLSFCLIEPATEFTSHHE